MDRLAAEFRQVAWILFGLCTALLGVAYKWLLSGQPAQSGNGASLWWNSRWFLPLVTSTSVYGLIFLGGLALYRYWLWALLPWNRRLDCRGKWYFCAWKLTPGTPCERIQVSEGTTDIEQTALSIKMSGSSSFSTHWQVKCVSFNARMQGFMAYTVLERDYPLGCLDGVCGMARFGPDHTRGDVAGRPRRLIFVCHEMSPRLASMGCQLLEIVYARRKEDLWEQSAPRGGCFNSRASACAVPEPPVSEAAFGLPGSKSSTRGS